MSAAPVPPDGEPQNPWRRPPTALERLMNDGRTADDIAADAWDKGFAAGRAAASPDPPESRVLADIDMGDDDYEAEARLGIDGAYTCSGCDTIHVPAASDERLREAAVIEAVAWSLFPDHPRPMSEAGLDCARRAIDTALFAAADREKPPAGSDGEDR